LTESSRTAAVSQLLYDLVVEGIVGGFDDKQLYSDCYTALPLPRVSSASLTVGLLHAAEPDCTVRAAACPK
jgi:hypothetical protein